MEWVHAHVLNALLEQRLILLSPDANFAYQELSLLMENTAKLVQQELYPTAMEP